MLHIKVTFSGEAACGKTRAREALKQALETTLPDKPYIVDWVEELEPGRFTEEGRFDSSGFSTKKQRK